jgi:hypothetical protein
MNSDSQWFKRNNYILLISFLILYTFVVLFLLRGLDDNRLASWEWAFLYADPAKIFLILIFSILIAYFLSRLTFADKHPELFLFIFSFAISSLFWREPEIILDASRYFTQAKHLEVYGAGYFLREWGKAIPAWTDMPVMPFLYGLMFKFFGEARIYVQIFTSILFSLTTALTYLIGSTIWNRDTGLIGGILFLGIPCILVNVPLMMVDVPVMFFVALSVFLFIKALEHGKLFIVASACSIALALLTKYSAWLMLSVLTVILVVYSIRESGERKKIIIRGMLVMSVSGLLAGAFILYKLDVFSEQIRFLLSFQKPGLKRWGESFLSTFFFQTHPFITIAAGYSVYSAIRKKDLKYLIILWMVLLVLLFQIKRSRYIMMIFPMLSLMASYGLMHIKNRGMIKFFAFCIACVSVVVAAHAYLPMTEKISLVNIRDAGEYINSLNGDTVELFTSQTGESEANITVTVPILDIFTSKKINYEYVRSIPIDKREVENLPLRFTWEYKNPDYYSDVNEKKNLPVVALISDDKTLKLPVYIEGRIRDYRRVKRFTISDEMFRFQVFVSVYSVE